MRKVLWFLVIALLIFGILSVHYTIGDWAHHSEWADGRGLPRPSFRIFVMGMAATVVAAGAGGWLLGRRNRQRGRV